jgi:hypothetical protein
VDERGIARSIRSLDLDLGLDDVKGCRGLPCRSRKARRH